MKATNVFFGIGIAVALLFLVLSGVNAFYPEPKYEDYCPENYRNPVAKPVEINISEDEVEHCDYQAYENANDAHKKNSFLIKSVIAIIFIIASVFFLGMSSVGNGILVAGILTLVAGFIDSFGVRTGIDGLRFVVGLLATGILVYLAIRYYNRDK